MPSDKRARQRAYREQKRAAEEARRRRRRRLRVGGSGLVVIAVVIALIVLLSSGSTPKPVAAKSTSTTTVPKTPVTPCPPAGGSAKRVTHFDLPPPVCIDPTGTYDATVVTNAGTFVIQMKAAASLEAVNNFVYLALYRFFDGTTFPRVIPGFVIQGGSPDDNITSGPGYSFTGNLPPASCTAKKDCYPNYSVAMANSNGPSTDQSQFFIVLPGGGAELTRNYTLFGQVVSGTSVVDAIGKAGNANPTDNGMPPKVTYHIVSVTISQPGASSSTTVASGSSVPATTTPAPTTTATAHATTTPAPAATAHATTSTAS